ncbi:Kazal-like protease inhibitor [Phytophthora infestans T30-4]|uniref:Kazal-like protease inhibitor n=1 Tax=Phytophthora infestans (strain T30-4) TaxID=403677 RepID=D0NI15_PHYIT|nr:Kazal-like protease inhibitor [Phytophthora infestans T30-4]EEY59100.1 Kazal-like protease inhibitor [Phytophthora infestans T30-4]|eukprot:XP_002901114.1 Kazal-like protease inhibitor [Phytophthora infestans T30-4]
MKLAAFLSIAAIAIMSTTTATPTQRNMIFVSGYTEAPCADTPCLPEHAPVCGSNGVTYENECELGQANCNNAGLNVTQVSYGACPCGIQVAIA